MVKVIRVLKDEIELIDAKEEELGDDRYTSNLLGVEKTIISSSIRYIKDCAFRIYYKDWCPRPSWFSGIHQVDGCLEGDIPEEAIFVAINIVGEDEEILNANIIYHLISDRIGSVNNQYKSILLD